MAPRFLLAIAAPRLLQRTERYALFLAHAHSLRSSSPTCQAFLDVQWYIADAYSHPRPCYTRIPRRRRIAVDDDEDDDASQPSASVEPASGLRRSLRPRSRSASALLAMARPTRSGSIAKSVPVKSLVVYGGIRKQAGPVKAGLTRLLPTPASRKSSLLAVPRLSQKTAWYVIFLAHTQSLRSSSPTCLCITDDYRHPRPRGTGILRHEQSTTSSICRRRRRWPGRRKQHCPR